MYKLSDFEFSLPDELIATQPAKPRDYSRLLVLDKTTSQIKHKHFYNIVDCLNKGDILVMNDSKVIPARLVAWKANTGGAVEILLHKMVGSDIWQCLLGGRVKENLILKIKKGFEAEILKDNNDGTWDVRFNKKGDEFMKAIIRAGEMPLPPYIVSQRKNKKEELKSISDKKNYQTVFADSSKYGSVAAPTAGLHFTKRLLNKIKKKGIKLEFITLFVGMGTFAPVKVDDPRKHKMHAEWVEINQRTKNKLQIAKKNKKRIIAVGTTTCRALEACFSSVPEKKAFKKWVDIFIYPSYAFKVVDGLITNFHLPKSTLLMLVSALAGKENIDKAYKEAVKEKYRFYSYGDAMFIK